MCCLTTKSGVADATEKVMVTFIRSFTAFIKGFSVFSVPKETPGKFEGTKAADESGRGNGLLDMLVVETEVVDTISVVAEDDGRVAE